MNKNKNGQELKSWLFYLSKFAQVHHKLKIIQSFYKKEKSFDSQK